MEKLSSNMSISELVRRTDAIVKEQMIAEVKDKIRERKILPILKDGKLSIYKISGKETLSELCDDYIDSMSDTYKRIVLSSTYDSEENFLHGAYIHERFTDSYRKCLNFFKDMTEHRPSTAEEIWKEFDLDNKRSRKLFIAENAKKLKFLFL